LKLLKLFKVSLDDGTTSIFPFSAADINEECTMGIHVDLFLMELFSVVSGTQLKPDLLASG